MRALKSREENKKGIFVEVYKMMWNITETGICLEFLSILKIMANTCSLKEM